MPWFWFLIIVVGIYLVVKIIQGVRDFVSWWAEGRAFAEEQKIARQRRQQGHPMSTPPALKEKPSSPRPKGGR